MHWRYPYTRGIAILSRSDGRREQKIIALEGLNPEIAHRLKVIVNDKIIAASDVCREEPMILSAYRAAAILTQLLARLSGSLADL